MSVSRQVASVSHRIAIFHTVVGWVVITDIAVIEQSVSVRNAIAVGTLGVVAVANAALIDNCIATGNTGTIWNGGEWRTFTACDQREG